MAKLLDTSFLIAYHNKRDEHHERAREIQIDEKVINDYIYAEVLNILYSRQGRSKAREYGRFLDKSTQIVRVSQPIFKQARENFMVKDLSFTDAAIAATAQKLGLDLISFDEDFEQFDDLERIS